MKKNIKIFALLFFILFGYHVYSQQNAQVNFTIQIEEFQSIKINPSQRNLQLVVNPHQENYNKKVVSENHIEVSSTTQYEIKVSCISDFKSGENYIPSEVITIKPSSGIGNIDDSIFSEVALNTNNQTIIKNDHAGLNQKYNLEYSINNIGELQKKSSGLYSTVIAYSVIPN